MSEVAVEEVRKKKIRAEISKLSSSGSDHDDGGNKALHTFYRLLALWQETITAIKNSADFDPKLFRYTLKKMLSCCSSRLRAGSADISDEMAVVLWKMLDLELFQRNATNQMLSFLSWPDDICKICKSIYKSALQDVKYFSCLEDLVGELANVREGRLNLTHYLIGYTICSQDPSQVNLQKLSKSISILAAQCIDYVASLTPDKMTGIERDDRIFSVWNEPRCRFLKIIFRLQGFRRYDHDRLLEVAKGTFGNLVKSLLFVYKMHASEDMPLTKSLFEITRFFAESEPEFLWASGAKDGSKLRDAVCVAIQKGKSIVEDYLSESLELARALFHRSPTEFSFKVAVERFLQLVSEKLIILQNSVQAEIEFWNSFTLINKTFKQFCESYRDSCLITVEESAVYSLEHTFTNFSHQKFDKYSDRKRWKEMYNYVYNTMHLKQLKSVALKSSGFKDMLFSTTTLDFMFKQVYTLENVDEFMAVFIKYYQTILLLIKDHLWKSELAGYYSIHSHLVTAMTEVQNSPFISSKTFLFTSHSLLMCIKEYAISGWPDMKEAPLEKVLLRYHLMAHVDESSIFYNVLDAVISNYESCRNYYAKNLLFWNCSAAVFLKTKNTALLQHVLSQILRLTPIKLFMENLFYFDLFHALFRRIRYGSLDWIYMNAMWILWLAPGGIFDASLSDDYILHCKSLCQSVFERKLLNYFLLEETTIKCEKQHYLGVALQYLAFSCVPELQSYKSDKHSVIFCPPLVNPSQEQLTFNIYFDEDQPPIKASKEHLIEMSSVIKAMLTGHFIEGSSNKLVMSQFSEQSVRLFVTAAHTGAFPSDLEYCGQIIELLEIAELYLSDKLWRLCVECIETFLESDTLSLYEENKSLYFWMGMDEDRWCVMKMQGEKKCLKKMLLMKLLFFAPELLSDCDEVGAKQFIRDIQTEIAYKPQE